MRAAPLYTGCLFLLLATGPSVFAQEVEEAAAVQTDTASALPDAEAYLDLLARVGTTLPSEEGRHLRKHLAQLSLILPEPVRSQVATGDWPGGTGEAAFKADAGAMLVAWWHSQDPLPASATNERLEEHLRRVVHAETAYASATSATGFDERGEVYLRYGTPSRQTQILFTDPRLLDAVSQPGVHLSPSDFPENEFWVYNHIERTGYFLFVKRGNQYQLAETLDLLPNALRQGFTSGRGEIRAVMALAVLRSIYEQLAVEHIDFGPRYQMVDQYVVDAGGFNRDLTDRVNRAREEFLNPAGRGEATGLDGTPELSNDQTLGAFVESQILEGRRADAEAVFRRQESMPAQFSEVFRDRSLLPLSIRAARFLDDNGTTRTEIYWGPQPGGLRFSRKQGADRSADPWSPNEFVILLTVVQQSLDYRSLAANQQPYLITDLPSVQDAAIPAQTMVVTGDTDRYHLALQWDQYRALLRETGDVQLGPQVQVATHRLDSLLALNPDERRLEMSDLKPLVIRDVATLSEEQGRAEPYPHRDIWPDLPLGFYFEVYHLTFGADDQAHYTITYEVVRGKQRSPLLRFLGQGDEERTSVSTPYTGTSRTAREYLMLDLSEWEGQGELEVRVRVKDETTGQEVSRTLAFTMNT